MAFIDINTCYRDLLRQQGLVRVADFLALSGVIVCGHTNRNVARVTLGDGPDAMGAYLKREHRVPWRDRLVNALAGFGFVSRSVREAQLLNELGHCGFSCPEVLAVGEDGQGRAFLLVRELLGFRELRSTLREASPERRLGLARRLGAVLAEMHEAGFQHLDLCAKHVLINETRGEIAFLDWQRSTRRRTLDWWQRCDLLAALDASLADNLASPRMRLRLLRSYLRRSNPRVFAGRSVRSLIQRVAVTRQRLLRRRHIREQRDTLPPPPDQNLVWLDGEALCVTREFYAALGGQVPDWLRFPAGADGEVARSEVEVPGAQRALLVFRRVRRSWQWLWDRLRLKRWTTPELHQADLLFRLQRYGIPAPRLLAVGQRQPRPGQAESFLLIASEPDTVPLADWLAERCRGPRWTAEHKQRWAVLRSAGALLRRLEEAGCCLRSHSGSLDRLLRVRTRGTPTVVLDSVEHVGLRRPLRGSDRSGLTDLQRLLARAGGSRTDQLRLIRAYLASPDLMRVPEHSGLPRGAKRRRERAVALALLA